MWGLRPHAPTRSAGLRRRRISSRTEAPRPAPSPLAGEGGAEGAPVIEASEGGLVERGRIELL